ncbi:Uncharacterised protein [Vibrio cholerae]|nr:Uncharacterised protein [Vibrio cholerae]
MRRIHADPFMAHQRYAITDRRFTLSDRLCWHCCFPISTLDVGKSH